MPVVGSGIFGFGTSVHSKGVWIHLIFLLFRYADMLVRHKLQVVEASANCLSLPIQLYLVDTYAYAASALAAAAVS